MPRWMNNTVTLPAAIVAVVGIILTVALQVLDLISRGEATYGAIALVVVSAVGAAFGRSVTDSPATVQSKVDAATLYGAAIAEQGLLRPTTYAPPGGSVSTDE